MALGLDMISSEMSGVARPRNEAALLALDQ